MQAEAQRISCEATKRESRTAFNLRPLSSVEKKREEKKTNNISAISNPKVSEPAKSHAREELDRYGSEQSDEERHEGNVKRGLRA